MKHRRLCSGLEVAKTFCPEGDYAGRWSEFCRPQIEHGLNTDFSGRRKRGKAVPSFIARTSCANPIGMFAEAGLKNSHGEQKQMSHLREAIGLQHAADRHVLLGAL